MDENFDEVKRQIKRKAWVEFIALILIFSVVCFSGLKDDVIDIERKTFDELRQIHGILKIEGNSLRNRRVYLVDNSGAKLELNLRLCNDEWNKYRGKPIDIWYIPRGKYKIAMVYQLAVNNKLISGLEEANDRVDLVNQERKKEHLFFCSSIVGFGYLIIGFLCYVIYEWRITRVKS